MVSSMVFCWGSFLALLASGDGAPSSSTLCFEPGSASDAGGAAPPAELLPWFLLAEDLVEVVILIELFFFELIERGEKRKRKGEKRKKVWFTLIKSTQTCCHPILLDGPLNQLHVLFRLHVGVMS